MLVNELMATEEELGRKAGSHISPPPLLYMLPVEHVHFTEGNQLILDLLVKLQVKGFYGDNRTGCISPEDCSRDPGRKARTART